VADDTISRPAHGYLDVDVLDRTACYVDCHRDCLDLAPNSTARRRDPPRSRRPVRRRLPSKQVGWSPSADMRRLAKPSCGGLKRPRKRDGMRKYRPTVGFTDITRTSRGSLGMSPTPRPFTDYGLITRP